jgi:thioredoxin 1
MTIIMRVLLSLAFFAGSSFTAFAQEENLSVEDFNRMINRQDKIVLVYFNADWCVPCIKLKPVMEQITAEEKATTNVLSIDVDKNPDISKHFEINTLPLFIIYKNGKKVWENNTALSKPDIKAKVDMYKEKK